MAQRRDSRGRFSGSGVGGAGSGGVANSGSKAAANRAAAKAAGMSFGAFMKQKAKEGRKIDKGQEQNRLTTNQKTRALSKESKKNEGRSWQEVSASVRRQQGRS